MRHWKPLLLVRRRLVVPVCDPLRARARVGRRRALDARQLPTTSTSSTTDADADATASSASALVLPAAAHARSCSRSRRASRPSATRGSARRPSIGALAALRPAPLAARWRARDRLAASSLVLGFIALHASRGSGSSSRGACAVPALLFERLGPFKALGRSFSLIKRPLVGVVRCSCSSATCCVSIIGGRPVRPARRSPPPSPATTTSSTRSRACRLDAQRGVTYPYLAAVLTILYFDQRVRKEGFDLQLLAEGLGIARDPDAPLPAPLIGDELYTPEQRAAAPYWPPPPGWVPPPPEPEPRSGRPRAAGRRRRPPSARPPRWSSGCEAPSQRRAPTPPPEPTPPPGPDGQPSDAAAERRRRRRRPPAGRRPRRRADREAVTRRPRRARRAEHAAAASGSRRSRRRTRRRAAARRRRRRAAQAGPRRADWLPPEAPRGPGGSVSRARAAGVVLLLASLASCLAPAGARGHGRLGRRVPRARARGAVDDPAALARAARGRLGRRARASTSAARCAARAARRSTRGCARSRRRTRGARPAAATRAPRRATCSPRRASTAADVPGPFQRAHRLARRPRCRVDVPSAGSTTSCPAAARVVWIVLGAAARGAGRCRRAALADAPRPRSRRRRRRRRRAAATTRARSSAAPTRPRPPATSRPRCACASAPACCASTRAARSSSAPRSPPTRSAARCARDDFDALAATFDDVVYGGRPPAADDLAAARERWPAVVRVRRLDGAAA